MFFYIIKKMHILHAKKHVKLLLHNHDRSHLSFHGEKNDQCGELADKQVCNCDQGLFTTEYWRRNGHKRLGQQRAVSDIACTYTYIYEIFNIIKDNSKKDTI